MPAHMHMNSGQPALPQLPCASWSDVPHLHLHVPLKSLLLPVRRKPVFHTCLSGSANSACPGSVPPLGGYRHSAWLCQCPQSGLELGQSLTRTGLVEAEGLYPGKQEKGRSHHVCRDDGQRQQNKHGKQGIWNWQVKEAKQKYGRTTGLAKTKGWGAWGSILKQCPQVILSQFSASGPQRAIQTARTAREGGVAPESRAFLSFH
jgi:hypothetical protein